MRPATSGANNGMARQMVNAFKDPDVLSVLRQGLGLDHEPDTQVEEEQEGIEEEADTEGRVTETVIPQRFRATVSDEPELGDPVDEELAKLMTNLCTKDCDHELLKEVREKYLRPSNATYVMTPRVNEPIWKAEAMTQSLKEGDLQLKRIQDNVVSGIHALMKITNQLGELLLSNPEDALLKDWHQSLYDGLFLVGHASFQLSQNRRDTLRPVFSKDYKALCAKIRPITELLFGSELHKDCKEMEETTKATVKALRKVGQPQGQRGARGAHRGRGSWSGPWRYSGYQWNPRYSRGAGSFRGRSSGFHRGRFHPYYRGYNYGNNNNRGSSGKTSDKEKSKN